MIVVTARRALALLGLSLLLAWAVPPAHADDPKADNSQADESEADASKSGPLAGALEQLDKGDTKAAEQALRQVLAGDALGTQDRAAALIYLGRIQLEGERFAEADATALKAIEELKKLPETHVQAQVIALSIRFEAAKGLGDAAKAAEIEQQAAALTQQHDQLAWALDRIPGGIIHRASGAVLPEAVDGLVEYRMNTYDSAGLDGSISYAADDADPQSDKGESYVTAYMTVNMGRTLDEHFESAKQEIMARYPDAREITSGPITVKQDKRTFEGKMGVFAVNENGTQAFTTLHIFRIAPDTHVKFRATYPVGNAEAMRARVASLMQSMVWPEGSTIQ